MHEHENLPERARRRRTWLPVVGAVTLVAVVVAVVSIRRLDDAWSRTRAAVAAAVDDLVRMDAADAPPTVGGHEDGAAWERYERARTRADFARLDALGQPGADGIRATIVAEHADAIAEVTAGAAHPRVGRPQPVGAEDGWALEALQLGQLVVAAAEEARAAEDFGRAAELACVALRFARDLAATGPLVDQMVGCVIGDAALDELGANLLEARSGDADRILRTRAFLRDLDASWPDEASAFRRERAQFGAWIVAQVDSSTPITGAGISRLSLWRYLFSERGFAIDWFDETSRQAEQIAAVAAEPWPAARAALAAAPAAVSPAGAMLVRTDGIVEQLRSARAHLRVVRAALAVRSGGTAPELVDPFAQVALQVADTDAGVRIASAGPDGLDGAGDDDIAVVVPR